MLAVVVPTAVRYGQGSACFSSLTWDFKQNCSKFVQICGIKMSELQPIPGKDVILPMLGKVRAAFTVAGPLSLAGKSESSIKVYMRVVKEILSRDKCEYFSQKRIKILEDKVQQAMESDDIDENARLIREGLEGIYDDIIDQQCGLHDVIFHPSDEKISRAIELCRPLVKAGRYADSVRIYSKVTEDLLNDSTLTENALSKLREALAFKGTCQVASESNKKLRKALDYVYDEIRLPEIYLDLPVLESFSPNPKGSKIMLFGAAEFGTGLEFESILLSDRIIGGQSNVEFVSSKEGPGVGLFKGSIKMSTDSGFAGVRFIPTDDYMFKDRLRNCQGLVISLKNMGETALRPKLQLYSEKNSRAFNWQAGFELSAKGGNAEGESVEIFLPLRHFWPMIFGHALPNNGNVQLDKVDSIGLFVSKIEENGSCNANFVECDFSIGVEWIAVLKDRTDI